MASTKEIITIQAGHYANFVGAQFWNLEESSFVYHPVPEGAKIEVNNNVLFREGMTAAGVTTFTPRLLVFDLKGSLKTLKEQGNLYESSIRNEAVRWENVEVVKSDAHEKNEFLKDLEKESTDSAIGMDQNDVNLREKTYLFLEDKVNVWSDILRVYYHPKTISLCKKYSYDRSVDSFNLHAQGVQLFQNEMYRDDVEERTRYFAEECDHLQGFQVLFDPCGGFGGMTAKMTSSMADDYNKKSIFAVPCIATCPNTVGVERKIWHSNCALSISTMYETCDMIAPISVDSTVATSALPRSFGYVEYDPNKDYHSSAVLAAAFNVASLPLRSRSNAMTLSELSGALTVFNRKLLTMSCAFPFPRFEDKSLFAYLRSLVDRPAWTPLVPNLANLKIPMVQNVVCKGLTSTQIVSELEKRELPYGCWNLEDVLRQYLGDVFPGCPNMLRSFDSLCKIESPFPQLFSRRVNVDGVVTLSDRDDATGVRNVAAAVALQNSDEMAAYTISLTEAIQYSLRAKNMCLEEDVLREHVETLVNISSSYQNSSGSTTDSDSN